MTTIDKKELDAARQELAEEKKSRKVGFAEEMGIRMKPYLQQAANDAAFGAAEWLDKYLKDITNGKDAEGIGKSINEIREDLNSFIADQTEANERIQEYLEDIDETVGGELSEEESEAEKKEKQAEDDEELMEVLTQGKVLDPTNNRLGKKDEEDKKKRNDENRKDREKLMNYIHDAILLLVMGARRLFNAIFPSISHWFEKIGEGIGVVIDAVDWVRRQVNRIFNKFFGFDAQRTAVYYDKKSLDELKAIDTTDLPVEEVEVIEGLIKQKEYEIRRKESAAEGRDMVERVKGSSALSLYNQQQNLLKAGYPEEEVIRITGADRIIPMPDVDEALESGSESGEGGYTYPNGVSEEPIGEVEDGAPSNSGTTIVNNVINHSSRNYYNSKNEPTRG